MNALRLLSRRRGRIAVIAVAALTLATAAAFALTRPQSPAPARPATPIVEFADSDLHVAQPTELARALPLTGTLRPYAEAAVKAKVAGELKDLAVREGDRVKAGQVIGHIDRVEASAQLAEREADREAARAQLRVAEKNQSMQKALLERHFISQNAFDTTQGNYEVARAKLAAADAAVAVARKTLGDTTLVAPMDGVVSIRHAQPGERVAVDGRVVTVVDVSRLELSAPVPASDIGNVKLGQSVEFRVEGMGNSRFAGRIDRINPAATAGSRSIEVYAVVDNPEGALRGGMFAQGRLIIGSTANALVVPATAIREERGERYVYVINAGQLERRGVTLGVQAGDSVQVAGGLRPGDTVVRHNLGNLREGSAVTVRRPAMS